MNKKDRKNIHKAIMHLYDDKPDSFQKGINILCHMIGFDVFQKKMEQLKPVPYKDLFKESIEK